MIFAELREMIIYIIKRETFFSREHAEEMTEDILNLVKEFYQKEKIKKNKEVGK